MKNRIVINSSGTKEYKRFGLNIRIQHIILMLSTILLIITGLPLKFFASGWAIYIMDILGGPENARELHHLGALGLIFIGIYHLLYIAFSKYGRADFKLLIPTKNDLLDFWNQLKYFFGKSKEKAQFGRFSFIEKFDYWAVYWGFVIMIGSGLVMWLFQGTLHPTFFGEINIEVFKGTVDSYIHAISRELHSDEALLATLAIIIWHFYNVHFNPDKFPGNKVWITGKMSEKEMEEEHPLELEEIEKQHEKTNEEKETDIIEEDSSEKLPENVKAEELPINYDEILSEDEIKEIKKDSDSAKNIQVNSEPDNLLEETEKNSEENNGSNPESDENKDESDIENKT